MNIGGSSDFEMRRAVIYQQNYYKMLAETYDGLDNYALESGEKLKDISFMYNNQPFQANLNRLAIELGIKGIEDSEEVEEGE